MLPVEFEHDVPGYGATRVAHPVRLSRGIEEGCARPNALSQSLDFPFEDDNPYVVRVNMRVVALAGVEHGLVTLRASRGSRWGLQRLAVWKGRSTAEVSLVRDGE